MTALLDVQGVTVRFGGVTALEDVSFSVEKGELLCLIGPNGAGKTTLLRAVAGIVKPDTARIKLAGDDITHLPIHRRARLGLAMTHQIVKPLRSMTVKDNVALCAGHKKIQNVFKAMITGNRSAERQKAMEWLEVVGIDDLADSEIPGLPLGVLKRLEVARALALEPDLLLLDEPLAGLNSAEASRLADTVVEINGRGMTVVMIEHNLGEVLRVAQRLVVLDNGRKIADGEPETVMRDEAVRAAYVGKEQTDAAA